MLYPDLLTARFNLRRACKELVLLEGHLRDPMQRCPDCIIKHALTFEALVDEARGLNGANEYASIIEGLARFSEDLNSAIRLKLNPTDTAESVRKQRKNLQGLCF